MVSYVRTGGFSPIFFFADLYVLYICTWAPQLAAANIKVALNIQTKPTKQAT